MAKIKICGLTRFQDADAVNQYRPDYAGFVFYPKSSRFVTVEQAEGLRRRIHPDIQTVGVFVKEEMQMIKRLVNKNIIQIVQLHGQETEDDIAMLRQCLPVRTTIIKAFQIKAAEDIIRANQTSADYPLLDHGTGGTGECFDWNLLRGMTREYFLAGGLNPENVQEVVSRVHPFAVDVSSGVETDRCKDPEKIRRFVQNAIL